MVPYHIYKSGFGVQDLIHEFSHTIDVYGLDDAVTAAGFPLGTWYSDTSLFQDAWKNDSSVPTEYAATAVRNPPPCLPRCFRGS